MNNKKRGQISLEYMIVLGFATLAITGTIALAFVYVNQTDDQIRVNHMNNFGKTIIDNAESVYYAGSPSKITISPYVPKGVEQIEFVQDPGDSSYVMLVTYKLSSGTNVIGFSTNVPLYTAKPPYTLSAQVSEGIKKVTIQFVGDEVDISW